MTNQLIDLTDQLHLLPPEGTQPAVGVITTSRGTLLIDAGNGPLHARRIRATLNAHAAPPLAYVIYTHHHWEQVFGAYILGAPVIAHAICRDILIEYASRPWSFAYLEDEIDANPALAPTYRAMQRAVDEWSRFRITLPAITFDIGLRLYRDDLTLEVTQIGGPHATDSIIVRAGDVLFLGDAHLQPDHTPARAVIERLLSDETVQTFITARDSMPLTRAEFAALLDS